MYFRHGLDADSKSTTGQIKQYYLVESIGQDDVVNNGHGCAGVRFQETVYKGYNVPLIPVNHIITPSAAARYRLLSSASITVPSAISLRPQIYDTIEKAQNSRRSRPGQRDPSHAGSEERAGEVQEPSNGWQMTLQGHRGFGLWFEASKNYKFGRK
ncbi:hypothetical protein B0H17DRAFT_1129133 [Mycena rosella]|uniref:Uncharacterized protein n=1 Tax=Mycena rosella TaxID=1033263 RepID=A0AAD7DTN5_MYCRO|nr:hypothetical protein B0H17DRAFT_1129133 [Mycena rosella]